MITHTTAAPRLWRFNSTVSANLVTNQVQIPDVQVHPNSGLAIVCKADANCTVRVTDIDPLDGVTFDFKDYAVTGSDPATIYHRGASGAARVEIRAGVADVLPDLRIFGMSQP